MNKLHMMLIKALNLLDNAMDTQSDYKPINMVMLYAAMFTLVGFALLPDGLAAMKSIFPDLDE